MKLLKMSEVMERFQVSRDTINRWLKAGKIRSVQVTRGGQHRFRADEIDRILAAGKTAAK